MAERVIMPKQGLQMTEGTIMRWLVQEGERCTEGEPLFEMETDKLTITIDAPASGILLKIVRGEGEVVPITELIGVIGSEGEDISSIIRSAPQTAVPDQSSENNNSPNHTPPKTVSAPAAVSVVAISGDADVHSIPKVPGKFTTPRARTRAAESGVDLSQVNGSGPDGLVTERDVLLYVPDSSLSSMQNTDIKATPLARKVAEAEKIALSDVKGSGAYGKITKDDILEAVAARASGTGAVRGTRKEPMTKMRSIIATRMVESLQIAAQIQHQMDCDMTNAAELRAAYKKKNIKISYNDIILMAASRALMEFPMMNASVDGESVIYHDYVNIGMAVAIDEGLIVPNIKNADLMRLEEIAATSKRLAEKAKNNTLNMSEMSEGTFTVSNLGMLGVDAFTAIINPPESGILAVGRTREIPVVVDHEITIRPVMTITLTYDHRIVDGAPAARFLGRVKELIEEPLLML